MNRKTLIKKLTRRRHSAERSLQHPQFHIRERAVGRLMVIEFVLAELAARRNRRVERDSNVAV